MNVWCVLHYGKLEKVFDSEEKAEKHVSDNVGNRVNKWMWEIFEREVE